MKTLIKEIKDCQKCLYCYVDDNVTRFQCSQKKGKFIEWISNKDKTKIPEWCPLPDSDFIKEEEMKI